MSNSGCNVSQHWPLGLNAIPPYVRLQFEDWLSTDEIGQLLLTRYAQRDVVYMLGGADVCNSNLSCAQGHCDDHDLAKDCGSMLQGRCRLQRGISYYSFLQQYFEENDIPLIQRAQHRLFLAPGVPHDACLMLMSGAVKHALFGWN